MQDEMNLRAHEAVVLVRVSPPERREDGIELTPFKNPRPDRGTVIDKSDAYGVENGDSVLFDHTRSTEVADNIWSVPIETSLLAVL